MKRSIVWLLPVGMLSLVWIIQACNPGTNFPPTDGEQEELTQNLLKSPAAYQRAMQGRMQPTGVTFTIEEISRRGKMLQIRVKGGCSEESFKVVWGGEILESYPMQVRLVLMHKQVDDPCQDAKDFFLMVDLTKIVGAQANLNDYVFHVANGSQLQDKTLFPDTTIGSG